MKFFSVRLDIGSIDWEIKLGKFRADQMLFVGMAGRKTEGGGGGGA